MMSDSHYIMSGFSLTNTHTAIQTTSSEANLELLDLQIIQRTEEYVSSKRTAEFKICEIQHSDHSDAR